ncbi:hypothetical protein [Halobaculum sp. EA56]|uniref:hypothetical protein n=1 Tax=Halobaculum sp. EA56 TaxID=3421648 RepID=UPI003EBBFF5C
MPEDRPDGDRADDRTQANRAGTSDHLQSDPRQSTFWSAVGYVAARWPYVAAAGLAGFLVASIALDVSFPRNARIIGLSAGLSALLVGRPVWSRVKSLLWNPSNILLVDLDADDRSGGGAWLVPTSSYRDKWKCIEGSPYWLTPNLIVTQGVDFAEKEFRGTWRGTLSDAELLRAIEAIRTCRDQLEDDARKGRRLDAQGWVIIQRAAHAGVRKVIETFEAGTLPDEGDGLDAAIADALEEVGLERGLSRVDDESPEDFITELDLDVSDVTGGGLPRQQPEAPADD